MLKDRKFARFYILALVIVALLTCYPVVMGVRVLLDMFNKGYVLVDDYPKYVIPYTPISIAVILGVAVMPLALKLKKYPLLTVSLGALVVFFLTETFMETEILVQTNEYSKNPVQLEGWQLGLCISYPGASQFEVWETVEQLLGGYDPSFKVHFYVISAVLILTILNCFYGFGRMVHFGDYCRIKLLVQQAVVTALFLGMCIWACFTAFYRTGSIHVSPVSALLMGVFFILFGTTVGIYAGTLFLDRTGKLSLLLPASLASAMTALMYAGEMLLLDGQVYRFGNGLFFDRLGDFALAPVDILIILLPAGICTVVMKYFAAEKPQMS